MLVLTRGLGETIVVGEGIEVTVVDIRGGRVRLGIAAPRSVAIRRKEGRESDAPRSDSLKPGRGGRR